MANHKSAEKRVRQNTKRNQINRSNRSKLRTQIKDLRAAIADRDKADSGELLNPTPPSEHCGQIQIASDAARQRTRIGSFDL